MIFCIALYSSSPSLCVYFYSFSWLIHRLCSPAGWTDAKFSACFLFFLLWARAPWKMCAPSIYPPLWDFETLVIYRSLAFPIILILFSLFSILFYFFILFTHFLLCWFLEKNPMISVLICVMFYCLVVGSLSLSVCPHSLPLPQPLPLWPAALHLCNKVWYCVLLYLWFY